MLYRFPPIEPIPGDNSFIFGNGSVFAKLKIENKAGKRTVLMTEHTIIFVLKGKKLLHFPGNTVEISAGQVFLLKKGIYVMAEYISAGLGFEALMLFLPSGLLKSIPFRTVPTKTFSNWDGQFMIFPTSGLIDDFKNQLRKYFNHRILVSDDLAHLKQTEILLLLISSGYAAEVYAFINTALSSEPEDIESIVKACLLQPITIPELAKLCNRSLASFKRVFQRQFLTSPKAWINQQRLSHAVMLLENTDKQITEVATACGFESTSYFIRIFKKTYGFTPQSMRAKTAIF